MDRRTGVAFLVGLLVGAVIVGGIAIGIAYPAVSEARRVGDEARASYERLERGLGNIVAGMDGALKEAERIGPVLERLRKRDEVYKAVASELRTIADGLDK